MFSCRYNNNCAIYVFTLYYYVYSYNIILWLDDILKCLIVFIKKKYLSYSYSVISIITIVLSSKEDGKQENQL